VVATLWPVSDLSTALVMVKFYEYLLHGDQAESEGPMPPALALHRAQQWLRDVTCAELSDLFDKYRHAKTNQSHIDCAWAQDAFRYYTLRPSNERPFSDPYFWAAFTFHGI
jgi:CHAT domain-containing protein